MKAQVQLVLQCMDSPTDYAKKKKKKKWKRPTKKCLKKNMTELNNKINLKEIKKKK